MIWWMLIGCPSGEFAGALGDTLQTGVLLGGYSDGDDLVMAGGQFTGEGTITRWDGDRLCVEDDPIDEVLWWVHGRGAGDWYAVGARGSVVHESGGQRMRMDIDTNETLFGVYDNGADIWAVSGDINANTGTIWRLEGDTWTAALETPDLMFKVWENWFVGAGLAYYWNGSEFEERHPPDEARLLTVRGRSDDDVYAVGGQANPIVLHWDGSSWEEIPWEPRCGGQNGLNGVWTAPEEDVWVAGHVGTGARWDGESWECAEAPLTSDDFHFVWKHDDDVVWGGGNLFSTANNHGAIATSPAPKRQPELQTCP